MTSSTLDRRRFLLHGGLAAVGIGSSGCAGSSSMIDAPDDRRGGLARLEALLEGTTQFRYHEDHRQLGPKTGHSLALVRHHDMQLQEHLRAMLVAGASHEIRPDDPEFAEFGSILRRTAVDIDASVLGSLSQVERMAEGDNPELLQTLRDEPHLPMEVCDIFEKLGASVGAPLASRNRLQRAATHLSWRLQRQDPGLVMAELATRSNRLLARAVAGPPVLPPEPGAPEPETSVIDSTESTDKPPPATPEPATNELPTYDTAPIVAYPEWGTAPLRHFIGQWASVELRNVGSDVYYVKRVDSHEAVLITTRGRKLHVDRKDIFGASPPAWNTETRAEAVRARVGGGLMLGSGISLIILGAALAPLTFGIGSIPITPGIGLLVTGSVFLARVPRVK
jgi:hypothetical protein